LLLIRGKGGVIDLPLPLIFSLLPNPGSFF